MKQYANQTVNADAAVARLKRFGWSMITLGGSMGLYYLGFFNSTEGPLNSEKIGTYMNDMGITGKHLMVILILLFLISVTWNWIYNLHYRLYRRKRANALICHGPKDTGVSQSKAHSPVRKGPWGHALWMAFLIILLCVILNMV